MLAKYLHSLRASKRLSTHQALSQLSGWEAGSHGELKKNFVFEDFHQASNFLQRYTDYCHQLNMVPHWANVYNRVTVSLSNSEFGGVTSKEVAAGSYLDMVSRQTLSADPEDVLSFS